MNGLRGDADRIIAQALKSALPDEAVRQALADAPFSRGGKIVLVAIGKAALRMAQAASEALGDRISRGIVITKYGHAQGSVPGLLVREAGHPVPDENSLSATREALEMVHGLRPGDTVLFLVSGGGSALFESPLIPLPELADVTGQMLRSGADIVEMNTVRKRLSMVKGGRFAQACAPASVYAVVLSDIIGDPLDMIASGPAYPDSSTCAQALDVVRRRGLSLSPRALALLGEETPKELHNVVTRVTGSVKRLCETAAETAAGMGYEPVFLTASLNCEAREAGAFLAAVARDHQDGKSLCFIAGGETVVHVKGRGKGGRNQEIALSAAIGIEGLRDTAVFSFGSDGTDGPTDAAGGYCDGETARVLREKGMPAPAALTDNDAYAALSLCGGLIVTGPTGTNVNDLSALLIRR